MFPYLPFIRPIVESNPGCQNGSKSKFLTYLKNEFTQCYNNTFNFTTNEQITVDFVIKVLEYPMAVLEYPMAVLEYPMAVLEYPMAVSEYLGNGSIIVSNGSVRVPRKWQYNSTYWQCQST